jgi:glycosyltransferase involved in cell wall biosynthesis
VNIGVSILTNGDRRKCLERCINSLLQNCYYRPLTIGILDNGSTDDTAEFLCNLPNVYGVEWRVESAETDQGCAKGTNGSIELVSDCEYQIHIESDFEHISEEVTGVDKMWLHRALTHMQQGCDYLYLRRMRNESEAAMHWWDQWMPRCHGDGEYLQCLGFWWSNNPVLFRCEAMKESKVLPLNESKDGPKGSKGWSQPELQAERPPNAWIHRWGVFVHDVRSNEPFNLGGCGGDFGPHHHGCKYGFWKRGGDRWCQVCDRENGHQDMVNHRGRFNGI